MSLSEDDESLANFLESEILSDQEREAKRVRLGKEVDEEETTRERARGRNRIETGVFGNVPPELFYHILKFLSSEDLISCSLVCRFLNWVASDESLWHRLYCMRWGLLAPTNRLRESAWKKLYIQRDEKDMAEFVRNCPTEFKEYYIQMQVAKRSQAPLPSQVNDNAIILDKTLSDQVSTWKSSRGLTDKVVPHHDCSVDTCTYYQIGDVYVCEKTGLVHLCDDTCREAISDPKNELLVCRISGHCFDILLSPGEMEPDILHLYELGLTQDSLLAQNLLFVLVAITIIISYYNLRIRWEILGQSPEDQQQACVTDEAEPFMGSGRFGRAYQLGYNCADEKELKAVLRFC